MQEQDLYCQEINTPIGRILVAAGTAGLCRVCFPVELSARWFTWFNRHFLRLPQKGSFPVLDEAVRQLRQYFSRQRKGFDLPFDFRGTPFQIKVWKELLRIPYGTTVSYGEMARRMGNPRASRAVGGAVGHNPVPILVPCHRVIGCDGTLVGFGGGLRIKEQLLELEGTRIPFGEYAER